MENVLISMNAIEVSFENLMRFVRSNAYLYLKLIHAVAIQNARIRMAVLNVNLARPECDRINVDLIVSILMSANTIFVTQTLLVRILPVHIIVNAMLGFLVMAIGAKILMNV